MKLRSLTTGILVLAAAALVSCSPYRRDFRRAAASGSHPDATGPFVGEWKSVPSGHEGPLWCMVSPTPGREGFHDFRYRAGWGLFRFGDYTHTAPVRKRRDGSVEVQGTMELPGVVGAYSLDGIVTREAFDATYTSTSGDHGSFALRRPE